MTGRNGGQESQKSTWPAFTRALSVVPVTPFRTAIGVNALPFAVAVGIDLHRGVRALADQPHEGGLLSGAEAGQQVADRQDVAAAEVGDHIDAVECYRTRSGPRPFRPTGCRCLRRRGSRHCRRCRRWCRRRRRRSGCRCPSCRAADRPRRRHPCGRCPRRRAVDPRRRHRPASRCRRRRTACRRPRRPSAGRRRSRRSGNRRRRSQPECRCRPRRKSGRRRDRRRSRHPPAPPVRMSSPLLSNCTAMAKVAVALSPPTSVTCTTTLC